MRAQEAEEAARRRCGAESRGPGVPESWSDGVPEFRSAGVPECGSPPGVPECRSDGVSESGVPESSRCPGVPVSRSPGALVSRCPGAPEPRCPGVPESRCPGAAESRCPGARCPVSRSPGVPESLSPCVPESRSPGRLSMGPAVRRVRAADGGRFVCVQWEDGSESRYPCVWLRDCCPCPLCFLPSAGARRLLLQDLDVDIVVKQVALADSRKISITWPDEHTSEYEAEWLKKRCFSEEARAVMRADLFLPEHQYWGSDLQLPKMPFEEIMCNDESAYRWLCTLKKVGIVLLTGAATRQGELIRLGQRIGFLRLTFYGPTWQVQDKADANNVAYTTERLCFHTDYPALQHPPGVQFLHCIKQTAAGGESEVVDGFHVSNKLKKQNPEAYQILSSTAVDYTDVGVDYCDFAVHCKQRIIDTDSRGQAIRINYNNATRDTVFDIPVEKVRPFYAALKEFNDLLNSAEHKFTFKMKPGDVLTFDNWRVLHGRQGYPSSSEVTRHLEGAYADWDVVMSRLQLLKKRVLKRD